MEKPVFLCFYIQFTHLKFRRMLKYFLILNTSSLVAFSAAIL